VSADVYFKRDIANAMLGTYQAITQAGIAAGNNNSAFYAGVRTVLSSLALNFGISPALVLPEADYQTRQLTDGWQR